MISPTQSITKYTITKASWGAVYSLALAVSGLITAEFLPASLLTPMAHDLKITEGAAGQTISTTAIAAMIASLCISSLPHKIDRKWILLSFSLLQIASNLLVVLAPGFGILLFGRILLGIGLGGFWAMSAAIAMRLVPKEKVPKALSIIFGSVSLATVIAAPMGSFLGGIIGWRNVFIIAAGIGAIGLIWQIISLPVMKVNSGGAPSTLFHILKKSSVKEGMLATLFMFMGYTTYFAYLRPFLEVITKVGPALLSITLLAFGVANFLGTTLARFVLEKSLRYSLIIIPLVMSILVAGFALTGYIPLMATLLIALWGMAFGIIQVAWPTWLTKTLPEHAETAGGLQVATIQLAITIGAGIGGVFFDFTGVQGVYFFSSAVTLIAGFLAISAFKKTT